MTTEPIFDVAHLAHVELLTPKLEESARFFIDLMGMVESGRKGDSIYLRGWDDYEHHTLQLTASATSGIGHYAVRASSPQALQRRVAALEKSGLGKGWNDKNVGHGPAYCFTDPDQHKMEIYYETEWYQPPEDPLVGVARQINVVRQLKARAPKSLVLVGTAYSYLQEYLPHVAQHVLRQALDLVLEPHGFTAAFHDNIVRVRREHVR